MAKTDRPIRLIHVSDIHFGSGESHGRVNAETGLNTRFEDFHRAFATSVDYAVDNQADVFLFSGDAYRNASPEPIYQKMFAAELRRLSEAGIKTILVVGNHDQILRASSSHSMSVFQSLAVPNLITIDRPQSITVNTANGAFQLVGLPHVTRHLLMTHEQYGGLGAGDIEKVLVQHVRDLLNELYEQLDARIPSVATAHMMLDRARAGAEQELMIGYSMTFPLDLFINPKLDYVALGHVHGHQVLHASNPSIVYAGSIERVDFGEEHEDKGFVDVQLERGKTTFQFHSVNPRPFLTIDADLRESDNPTKALCEAIEKKLLPGCVLRIRYRIKQEQAGLLDERAVRIAAAGAMSLQLKADVSSAQREVRMPQLTESAVYSPLAALEIYLQQVAPESKERYLARARELCEKLQSEER